MRFTFKKLISFGLLTFVFVCPSAFSQSTLNYPKHKLDLEQKSKVISQISKDGILTVGIYTGNFLLVTGKDQSGNPDGVSPDMAKAIATDLGLEIQLQPYAIQGHLVEAVAEGRCGIGLVGSDPDRAQKITFAPAYVEIEATYLVPAGSKIQKITEVDQKGVRIASFAKSAYDLWLVRNIQNATLVHADNLKASVELFMDQRLDALAGLRTGLVNEAQRIPGSRILDGQFMAVQQGIATKKSNLETIEYLTNFVENAKKSGLVQDLINKHKVTGLSVAKI
jgi:polar amino acid transport system substrate-binding protein